MTRLLRPVLSVLLLAGCGGAALGEEPPPTSSPPPTTVEAPATLAPALVITAGQHCLDGTQAVQAQTVSGLDCRPWPTRCLDGERFVIPVDAEQAGTCRPSTLYEMVSDEFGPETHIASAVITCESHWSPTAVGPRVVIRHVVYHAIGLMQILVADGGRRNGRTPAELKDPPTNLVVGHEIRNTEGWDAWDCFR